MLCPRCKKNRIQPTGHVQEWCSWFGCEDLKCGKLIPVPRGQEYKMIATKVTYKRTVNLGNYENESLEMEVQLDEGEKASEAFKILKENVESLLGVAEGIGE